jgi:hypothetical protein
MARWHTTEFDMLPEHAFQQRGWKGGMTLEGGGGSSYDPNTGEAAQKMAELAAQQWDTFKTDIYPAMTSQVQQQEGIANNIANTEFLTGSDALSRAGDAYKAYENTALPALQKLKADADNYNEAGYQEQLAQGAAADVTNAFDQQRQATTMRQQAYGIDPTSGAAAGADRALGVQQALYGAQASNQVREAAHQLGLQKQANLYNMGTGLAGLSAQQTSLGLGALGQGFGTRQSTLANYGALSAALQGQAGTAMSGYGNAANTYASMANSQRQADAASSAGWGQMVGAGLGAYATYAGLAAASDIATKQDVELVGMLPNGVNVYEFEYKPEFRDEWGHGRKIGVIAQEVEHIPGAVHQHPAGYKLVDYGKVVSYGI